MRSVLILIILLLLNNYVIPGQSTRVISTSMPQLSAFSLTIAPDARAASMGEAGAATAPDINSQHWNPAKYAFIPGKAGLSISYAPWLRNLCAGINHFYLAGYYRINDRQALSTSLRYFTLGEIIYTSVSGTPQGSFHPNEEALDLGYSLKLGEHTSVAAAARYIRSDVTGVNFISGAESFPGNSLAADIAFYHTRDHIILGKEIHGAYGLNLSNLGTDIFYPASQREFFIPANIRFGTSLAIEAAEQHSIGLAADLNRLFIITPLPDNIPGGWNHITISLGGEYLFRDKYALRTGYFHEGQTVGNRKYVTMGLGAKIRKYGAGISYLLPVRGTSPLNRTFRISASFEF